MTLSVALISCGTTVKGVASDSDDADSGVEVDANYDDATDVADVPMKPVLPAYVGQTCLTSADCTLVDGLCRMFIAPGRFCTRVCSTHLDCGCPKNEPCDVVCADKLCHRVCETANDCIGYGNTICRFWAGPKTVCA